MTPVAPDLSRVLPRVFLRLASSRRLARPLLAAACAACSTVHAANETADATDARWQIDGRYDEHSDALPLRAFGKRDAPQQVAPRGGTNLAYADNLVRASRIDGNLTWSLLTRQSATLIANQDALAVYADVGTPGRPAQSERREVHARFLSFAGTGVELQRRWQPRRGWTLDAGVQGLALQHLRERRIDGAAGFDALTQAYDFDLREFAANDRFNEPFQRSFAPRGWGLLFSGQLAWQDGAFGARLAWRDAGWLRWSGLPQQDIVVASATRAYDSDGFVIYQPLLQGSNSQPGRTVLAPLRTTLAADWRPDAMSRLEVRLEGLQHYGVLPAVSGMRQFGDVGLDLTWRVHERRATVGMAWRGLRIDVGADRLGAGARSQELALRYRWPT